MRCTTYCTAAAYDIPRLFQSLHPFGLAQMFRDCVHLQLKEDKLGKGDVFYLSYGCVVLWGLTEEEERVILTALHDFEKEPMAKPEMDEFTYIYADHMRLEEDEISLPSKNTFTKLAISYGLAQSVKLTTFEETIQKTIDNTKHLPENLATKGKISMSRKDISRKMGELFLERNFINLHSEILDTPEFFWNYPELEPFYRRTTHYLETTKRGEVLNKKLAVIHELFEILSNEINHQHSSRLEWIIIVLISIEICMVIIQDFLHLI
ncbi:RMD1 family protein [Rhabdochlamydiaceae symbiont of Dictyostelium giganteum]|uniref:RMD1 family protein n=1 Tax=Rhabdochlamydiaceae symbiont of Dictyostelium giganteum TaxID=3342349 RepID=UPI00384F4A0D